jgi:hypothetical protein
MRMIWVTPSPFPPGRHHPIVLLGQLEGLPVDTTSENHPYVLTEPFAMILFVYGVYFSKYV